MKHSLNYFDPETHEEQFSDDALGNLQRWVVIMHELLTVLCKLTGVDSWVKKKDNGVKITSTP